MEKTIKKHFSFLVGSYTRSGVVILCTFFKIPIFMKVGKVKSIFGIIIHG